MIVNVIGIRRNFNFQTKDGQTISGSSIYVTHEVNGVEGLFAERFFLSNNKFNTNGLVVPCTLDLQFNRYGKIDGYSIVEE